MPEGKFMSNLNDKMKQLDKIKNGHGVQCILDKIYEIMGNPILVFDMEYRLIASSTCPVDDDPIWREFIEHGKLSDETIEFFKNESFIDSVADCTQFDEVTYLSSDKLKYDRIFGQLHNSDRLPVADLIMMACVHPFEEDTQELIKTVCNIISEELSQDEYYQDYGQIYQDNIIKLLIEAAIDDKGVYTGHVSNIERGLKANIFIAVVDITQARYASTELEYFRDLFKWAKPDYKYSIYGNHILILMSSASAKLSIKKDLNELNKLCTQENIYVGISSCFENPFELHRYYDEAMDALHHGKRTGRDRHITFF